MPLRYIHWICCTLLIFTSTLRGQSLLPDRPDVTESPFAVPSRNLQCEAGVGRNDERVIQSWQAMVRFGIGGGREIRFLSGIHTPTELSLKQNLYKKEAFATGAILMIGYNEDVMLRAILPMEMGGGAYSAGINLTYETALLEKSDGTSRVTHSHAFEITKALMVFAEGVHVIEDALEVEQLNFGGYYRADDLLAFDVMLSVNPMIGISQFGLGVSWLMIGCTGNFEMNAVQSRMDIHPEEHVSQGLSAFS